MTHEVKQLQKSLGKQVGFEFTLGMFTTINYDLNCAAVDEMSNDKQA